MYAQIVEDKIEQIVDEFTLRALYPSTHFPENIQDAHLEGFDGWVVVKDNFDIPPHDKTVEKAVYEYTLNKGKVTGAYNVVALSNAEKEKVLAQAWTDLRYNRDALLRATDYLVLPDVFAQYSKSDQDKIVDFRKKLRDITDTDNPIAVTYPTLDRSIATIPYIVRS